jgi:hypothetical protein
VNDSWRILVAFLLVLVSANALSACSGAKETAQQLPENGIGSQESQLVPDAIELPEPALAAESERGSQPSSTGGPTLSPGGHGGIAGSELSPALVPVSSFTALQGWVALRCTKQPLRFANTTLFVIVEAPCAVDDGASVSGAPTIAADAPVILSADAAGYGLDNVTLGGAEFFLEENPRRGAKFELTGLPEGLRMSCLKASVLLERQSLSPSSSGLPQRMEIEWRREPQDLSSTDAWERRPSSSVYGAGSEFASYYLLNSRAAVEITVVCQWIRDQDPS